jgi:hypothetical protein
MIGAPGPPLVIASYTALKRAMLDTAATLLPFLRFDREIENCDLAATGGSWPIRAGICPP